MRMIRLALAAVALVCLANAPAPAEELLPPDRPIEQVIDHYVDLKLKEAGVAAAAQADDANLIRRLSLDLAGRIPTVAETRAFLDSSEGDKRVRLVDRLLASPGCVRHQANELDVMLMAGTRGSMRDYLAKAVADNRPWDQVFRDVVLPNEQDPKLKSAGEFVRQRVSDVDKLTTEASSIFFGVNISCARCHDHPKVPDWKQDHFFGMKSFFNRTFDNGGFVAEREYGLVKFKTTKGEERKARLMFLTGKAVDEPSTKEPSNDEQKKEKEYFERFKKSKTPPPPPKFSARARLVELALQPGQNEFFARSIVNRLWARLFGYGLVMPVDQMHSENPPSHPELLQWLARDLVAHGYDLRRLTRGLALSRAYARSSRWETGETPKPQLFAVARVRPLTPMQLALSLRLATSVFPPNQKPEEFEKQLEGLDGSARGFASLIEQPGEDFQVGAGEALLFSNSDRVWKDYLADGGDRLIGRLKQLKDRKEMIDLAVRSVLSRPPTADEVKLLDEFLGKRDDRMGEACKQLVWALLTGAEFRFNY